MIASQEWFLVGIGGAVLALVVLCVLFFHYWHGRSEALRDVRGQFNSSPLRMVSSHAYFNGFERKWDGQWRGFGVLVLTREVLHFRPWNRALDITIPAGRIQRVTGGAQRERKWGGYTLLRVEYVGMDDQARTATWSVMHAREWMVALAEVRERNGCHVREDQAQHLSEDADPGGSSPALER